MNVVSRPTLIERLTRGHLYAKVPTWLDVWFIAIASGGVGYLLGAR